MFTSRIICIVGDTRKNERLFIVFIPLMLLIFHFWSNAVLANDGKWGEKGYEQHENSTPRYNYNDRRRRQVTKEDEGNEVTGQTAAWLLVSANLTVALSILMKGVSRYFPLEPGTRSSINKMNQLQKRYLMRFHFVLNPLALGMAVLHFLLSSCRKSSLPEWGLVFVTMMVLLGLMVRFKVTPRWLRKQVYRLHTGFVTFSTMIILLVAGHHLID